MVTNIRTEESYEVLWGAIPYPAFKISFDTKIADANVAAETYCLNSIKQIKLKSINVCFGENSIVLSIINQARETLVSVSIYDVDVLWPSKLHSAHDIVATPINNSSNDILLMFHPHGMSKKIDRSLSHQSAARSVTGMASMLAHEIRNPLAGISGAAQLLMASISDDDKELLGIIQTEVSRIGTLVDRFEVFGDKSPLNNCPINLHTILNQATKIARVGYAKDIKIKEIYDPSLPFAKGDPDLLIQLFQNLLKNAAEAVPLLNGQIVIETAFRQGIKINLGSYSKESLPLQVSVIDNGIGVPEQIRDDIYEPFVTSKATGSGLGLSLVSKIISDHGGVIEYSRVKNRTVFSVLLPVWVSNQREKI